MSANKFACIRLKTGFNAFVHNPDGEESLHLETKAPPIVQSYEKVDKGMSAIEHVSVPARSQSSVK